MRLVEDFPCNLLLDVVVHKQVIDCWLGVPSFLQLSVLSGRTSCTLLVQPIPFRINTFESVSKQEVLSPFRIGPCERVGTMALPDREGRLRFEVESRIGAERHNPFAWEDRTT